MGYRFFGCGNVNSNGILEGSIGRMERRRDLP
jgi:hypothetical protein